MTPLDGDGDEGFMDFFSQVENFFLSLASEVFPDRNLGDACIVGFFSRRFPLFLLIQEVSRDNDLLVLGTLDLSADAEQGSILIATLKRVEEDGN